MFALWSQVPMTAGVDVSISARQYQLMHRKGSHTLKNDHTRERAPRPPKKKPILPRAYDMESDQL